MNVLVIDTMPLYVEGISHALRSVDPAMIVRCASDVDHAWMLASQHVPDIVLLDYELTRPGHADVLDQVIDRLPGVPTLIMVRDDVRHSALETLTHGAAGLLPRNSTVQTLLLAIRQVLEGSIYVPRIATQTRGYSRLPCAANSEMRDIAQRLTPRQLEILQLLAQGKSNKQICRSIGAAEGTVKNHLHTIFRILGVHNRTEAAIFLN